MAFHDDLLEQAEALAHADKKKPKQANLRRAVSAAYYALFHLLGDHGSRFLVSGTNPHRDALRRQLARSFDHAQMKKASQAFATPKASDNPWRKALAGPPSVALVDVASAFIDLQEARHEADYDLSRTFTRGEVAALVAQACAAFVSWNAASGTPEADAFLVALLVKGRI